MNIIFIVPTGIGTAIGGHAGDATPAARLIAATCENLILHPNVVNASDINEMPPNGLYVTGETIDDLLRGYVGIEKVRANRIAIAVNKPVPNEIVNLASAARATAGIDCFVVGLPTELRMTATFDKDGTASGSIEGAYEAAEFLQDLDEHFDAVAVISKIEVPLHVARTYTEAAAVNPWGGVEAKLTRVMTDFLKVPVAHAPFGHTLEDFNEIVDPRMAAEFISLTYSFCLMKGLHKAPRIVDSSKGLSRENIDALVSPIQCFGIPHEQCEELGIPIIMVEDNLPVVKNSNPINSISATSYAEAAGCILALREGISRESLRRPLKPTLVL